jgi:hypothetical protein
MHLSYKIKYVFRLIHSHHHSDYINKKELCTVVAVNFFFVVSLMMAMYKPKHLADLV